MPTTRPQKSVNLEPDDHDRAQKVAKALTKKLRDEQQKRSDPFSPEVVVTIKGAIAYGLRLAEKELEQYTE
jgi:hypothetical protein